MQHFYLTSLGVALIAAIATLSTINIKIYSFDHTVDKDGFKILDASAGYWAGFPIPVKLEATQGPTPDMFFPSLLLCNFLIYFVLLLLMLGMYRKLKSRCDTKKILTSHTSRF